VLHVIAVRKKPIL